MRDDGDRPRERLLRLGAEALSDAELLTSEVSRSVVLCCAHQLRAASGRRRVHVGAETGNHLVPPELSLRAAGVCSCTCGARRGRRP